MIFKNVVLTIGGSTIWGFQGDRLQRPFGGLERPSGGLERPSGGLERPRNRVPTNGNNNIIENRDLLSIGGEFRQTFENVIISIGGSTNSNVTGDSISAQAHRHISKTRAPTDINNNMFQK